MLIRTPQPGTIPEREAAPESLYLSRRRFLQTSLVVPAATAAFAGEPPPRAGDAGENAPAIARNPKHTLDRPLTEEIVAARHNIFDEFALERDKVWIAAKNFRTSPWKLHIGGAVRRHRVLDASELVRLMGTEERVYRHRCVETWAMAVPWTGFPLRKLVEWAEPLSKAKYLRMISFTSPEQAPGWYASKRVFPYYEALSLSEATNDLAFLATGIYGHELPPQHGAPIRLVVPWKYGFKSIKSIVAFQFTVERPGTFWNDLAPDKYTFDSNVEPHVPRPWPQDKETMLGTGEVRETLPFNGYGELVAHLYA